MRPHVRLAGAALLLEFLCGALLSGAAAAPSSVPAAAAAASVRAPARRATAARANPAAADSLRSDALARLALNTLESRRRAIEELDQAARLAPDRADLRLDLARACTAVGEIARARESLESAAAIDPDDAGIQFRLGRAWKWDWLASLDRSSLARALDCLTRAARLASHDPEPRVELSALALAEGNTALAVLAARSARYCDGWSVGALLALGSAAYRAGALAVADSAFDAALPRLSAEDRRRFADLSPLAGDDSALAPGRDPADARAFWAANDPDLTTPENEAELDFKARVAHALILFRDDTGLHWDVRAQLFIRYGMPATIELNPSDDPLSYQYVRHQQKSSLDIQPPQPVDYKPPPLEFPYNLQRWSYPSLGIVADLWDQSLSQTYQLPIAVDHDPDPRPDPALIANRPDVVAIGAGRGVYLALPPGVAPLATRAVLSQFPSDSGARLVVQIEAPGQPADSLSASWAVLGSDGRRVAYSAGALSISACDPTERRVAEFSAELPPGEYRTDVAVSDAGRRRGVVHLGATIPSASPRLALSDLVLLCGSGAVAANESAVRIEPNFERRVSGERTLSAYFEIARLAAGPDGRSRFEYVYAIRPVEHGEPGPRRAFEASRQEENVGPLRRQFVTVPIQSLRPGTYDLEIEVRDLVAGTTAARTARFVKA